jgi:hypothetical protein
MVSKISGILTLYKNQPNLERRLTMRLTKNPGMILLAIWLILFGLSGFINLGDFTPIMNVLAIIAGVVLLLAR